MCASRRAVNPYGRLVIACADIQDDAFALINPACGQYELTSVPDRCHEVFLANTRKITLRAEGHQDFPTEVFGQIQFSCFAGLARVYFKIPFAVEIDPIGSYKLWPGYSGRGIDVVSCI